MSPFGIPPPPPHGDVLFEWPLGNIDKCIESIDIPEDRPDKYESKISLLQPHLLGIRLIGMVKYIKCLTPVLNVEKTHYRICSKKCPDA